MTELKSGQIWLSKYEDTIAQIYEICGKEVHFKCKTSSNAVFVQQWTYEAFSKIYNAKQLNSFDFPNEINKKYARAWCKGKYCFYTSTYYYSSCEEAQKYNTDMVISWPCGEFRNEKGAVVE